MKLTRSILAAAVLGLGISAYPQSLSQQSWTVKVPFDFTVRHTNMEAGRYTVKQYGPVVTMTSQNGKTANVLTNSDYTSMPAAQSSLVFNVNGGEYALAQIKNKGSNTELKTVVNKHSSKRLEASNPQVEVAAVGTR